MKLNTTLARLCYVLMISSVFMACQKAELSAEDDVAANAIPVATSHATASNNTDSVYIMHSCRRGERRDTIAQANLSASITSYINSNYDNAAFHKAFVVKNNSEVVAYVVVIYYNDKPVGLLFDSKGNFVKVLEQRERDDLRGPGHHRGGLFEHRDGRQRDTVALADLSATIKTYLLTQLNGDTLVKAFVARDGYIVVISKNNGLFATVFSSTGVFVKRVELPARRGWHQAIELAQLPSAAANYLAQTYPNYVFQKAFSISVNGSIVGYVTIIDANNTKYAIEFDASGNYLRSKTIR